MIIHPAYDVINVFSKGRARSLIEYHKFHHNDSANKTLEGSGRSAPFLTHSVYGKKVLSYSKKLWVYAAQPLSSP
ncbi:hypothetical protein, partial [Desulfocicer niacini]